MYCPSNHNWQQANAYVWKSAWRRMRRLLPFLESMASTAWLGPVMVPPNLIPPHLMPPYPPEDAAGPGADEPAGEPPPGHPERLAADRPPTRAERELWAGLNLDIEPK